MISPGGLVATLFKSTGAAVAAAVDATFNYVSLHLNGEPPVGTSTFLSDASTNALALTPVGTIRPDNFSPFAGDGYYSTYFSVGNRIGVPSNAALGFGTGDFTVEVWVNCAFTGAVQEIIDARSADNAQPFVLGVSATGVARTYDGTTIRTGGQLNASVWNHVAWVRASNVNTVYVNGIAGHTWTASQNFGASNQFIIGDNVGTGATTTEPFTGYMSNLRVVKGTAVYTANFAVPTTPLTTISGTSLLLLTTFRHVDKSSNALTLTFAGSPRVSYNNPIGNKFGSIKFNGTTDYITTPSSAANNIGASTSWTIEAWVHPTAYAASNNVIVYVGAGVADKVVIATIDTAGSLYYLLNGAVQITTTTAPVLNSWNHIALVKNNATTTLYLNGVSLGTSSGAPTSSSKSVTIGADAGGALYGGYISNFRIIAGTALYTSAFTPSTAPLTAVAGTSLLTCQGNVVDASSNAFAITTAGTPSASYASPFPQAVSLPATYGSAYFNGTTDYLTSSMTALGSGNFTIECWVYVTAVNKGAFHVATASALPSTVTGIAVEPATGGWNLYWNGQQNTSATGTPAINTWHHIAVVKNSGVTTLYVNGTANQSGADSTNYTGTVAAIGGFYSTAYLMNGYVSNFRIVAGTALYTGAFTPSATPLTAVANTSLLTLQSPTPASTKAVLDYSQLDNVITTNGTPGQGTFSPFSQTGWSAYFNGAARLTAPGTFAFGTSAYTIEAWVNFDKATPVGNETIVELSGATRVIFGRRSTGAFRLWIGAELVASTGVGPTIGSGWKHVALVHNASVTSFYLDGVYQFQIADTTNLSSTVLSIGNNSDGAEPMSGYISNVRITAAAVYTTNFTPSTSPLTATANTKVLACQSNRFVDNGTNASVFTATSSTIQAVSPFEPVAAWSPAVNGSSMYFNGTTDYLTASNASLPVFGTNDFTVETWVYPTVAGQQSFVCNQYDWSSATGNWCFYCTTGSAATMYFNAGGANHASTTTTTIPLNQWTHIAYSRGGTSGRFFVNGTQLGTAVSDTTSYVNSAGTLYIGDKLSAGGKFTGYMADTRITGGTAVYTTAFTPPTAPLQPIPGTSLLLKGTPGIVDAAGKNDIITVGGASTTTAVKKYGTSSLKFSNFTDWLLLPNNQSLAFGTGNFTVECWINQISGTNNGVLHISTATNGFPGTSAGLAIAVVAQKIQIDCAGAAYQSGPTGPIINTNTWYHIAVVRSNGVTKLYVNGTLDTSFASNAGQVTDATNYTGTYGVIGAYYTSAYGWNGYVDDLRITKGAARYTANFTPPTAALPTN
jgi:hypothetical protein